MTGMEDLRLLKAFLCIAESGSISAAARILNTSQPTLSRRLGHLERTAGVALIRRDTHSLRLTTAGLRLLDDAREIIGLAETASQRLHDEQGAVRGHLRVLSVVDLGQWVVSRFLALFLQQNPLITAELHLFNRASKFVEEGFDCGVLVGRMTDLSVTARKIAEIRRLLVASPEFLKQHGSPSVPEDLPRYPWMGAVQPHFYSRDRLTLLRGRGQCTVDLRPALLLDSVTALREAAIAGAGVTMQPEWLIGDALATGRLVHVLPKWRLPPLNVYIAFPPSRHLPGRVRAFVNAATERIPKLLEERLHPTFRKSGGEPD